MSLLYECINGIIQGGILGSEDDVSGREEIASLCVSKLRGMVLIDGDPNRKLPSEEIPWRCQTPYSNRPLVKYVALLAFNKIVKTHPLLVAEQEDVILECIDAPDVTIRIAALDLAQGMVSSENLVSIVSRLMRQLKQSASAVPKTPIAVRQLEFKAESDDEGQSAPPATPRDQSPPLPEEYKLDVIGRILSMCSHDNYTNIVDFEWYIDILTQLTRTAPIPRHVDDGVDGAATDARSGAGDVSERIGDELRNVAVKVKAVRPNVVRAADMTISQLNSETPSSHQIAIKALKPMSWVVGEYASLLVSPEDTLGYILQLLPRTKAPEVVASCLQSVMKLFSLVAGDEQALWTAERKSRLSLLMARIIHVLEPLALHPSLEVQERAVEFTELLKLATEAASAQPASTDEIQQDPPLLLTQAIPSLFQSWELNSVAVGAQRNVPLPGGLDLDEPIHPNLAKLLDEASLFGLPQGEDDDLEDYYHQRPPAASISSSEPAINKLRDGPEEAVPSYQQAGEESYLDPDILARRKAERLERNRDDPFYIHGGGGPPRISTPIHDILQDENGNDLDIDAIPIMKLDLNKLTGTLSSSLPSPQHLTRPKPRQKLVIAADETLGGSGVSTPRNYESENNSDSFTKSRSKKLKHSLLQVDSSHIGALSLDDGHAGGTAVDFERQQRAEAEMAQALKEVEKRRLEMQRANERIQVAAGVDAEGTLVKKKKAKKVKVEGDEAGAKAKVKKKKKAAGEDGGEATGAAAGDGVEATEVVKPKKKKKAKVVDLDTPEPAA